MQSRTLALIAGLVFAVALLAAPQTADARRYAAIVIDAETGEVLHAANPDRQAYPASMTKMMTLYMLFEAIEQGRYTLDSKLKVSARAAGMPPSKLGLRAGSTIRVKDAIGALVTKSANDVAVVVAEAIAGSEYKFGIKATEKARELGMSRTVFRNASGLPDRHQLSTARDMARLGQALIRHYPQYYHFFSLSRFSYNGNTYRNHNKLLDSYPGVDGLKTGYIRASGFNLAASAVRNGRRIIAVVYGGKTSRSRNAHMVELLDRGFSKMAVAKHIRPDGPPPEKPLLLASNQIPAASQAASLGTSDSAASEPMPISESHGIQVGAFSDPVRAQTAAEQAIKAAPAYLVGQAVRISQIPGQSTPLYRARLIGMQQSEAEAVCRLFRQQQRPCIVVRADRLDLASLN
ncbi:MAG: D-alanyl-D-alanine carboxypeptidase [Limibacillus sp.]